MAYPECCGICRTEQTPFASLAANVYEVTWFIAENLGSCFYQCQSRRRGNEEEPFSEDSPFLHISMSGLLAILFRVSQLEKDSRSKRINLIEDWMAHSNEFKAMVEAGDFHDIPIFGLCLSLSRVFFSLAAPKRSCFCQRLASCLPGG